MGYLFFFHVRRPVRAFAGRFFVCKEQMTDDEAGLLTKKRTRRQLHLVTIIRVHVIGYLLVNIDCTIYLPYTHRRSNVDCRDLTHLTLLRC